MISPPPVIGDNEFARISRQMEEGENMFRTEDFDPNKLSGKPQVQVEEPSTANSYFNNILHIFPLFNNSFQSVTNLVGASTANSIICASRKVHFEHC